MTFARQARQYPYEHRDSGLLRGTVLAALVVIALLAYLRYSRRLGGDEKYVGTPIATFDLAPLAAEASPLTRDDLLGKVTLVNFWATWCGPCIDEFPELLTMAAAHRERPDFRFVSVSSGNPDPVDLRVETESFLKRYGYDLPVHADPGDRVRRALAEVVPPGPVPVTLLIDREAKLASVCIGFDSSKLERMKLQIETLLRAQ